ncbi:hypothetical protein SANT12839_096160 [Streptomyces antimycoticus]|uniref:Uncharacterized protein n=1 Tax=Streptomyces antimycoticus TaxID=68175 RepID=A0A4D4KKN0_9ACTN|nr:hypothetical protein SANT12839_096160 [Streptomyces antimycoticus]
MGRMPSGPNSSDAKYTVRVTLQYLLDAVQLGIHCLARGIRPDGTSGFNEELRRLGQRVAAATIPHVLCGPGPPRTAASKQQTWRSLLRFQAHTLLSCDRMHMETVFLRRLRGAGGLGAPARVPHDLTLAADRGGPDASRP